MVGSQQVCYDREAKGLEIDRGEEDRWSDGGLDRGYLGFAANGLSRSEGYS